MKKNLSFFSLLLSVTLILVSGCSQYSPPKRYALVYGISKYIDSFDEGQDINLTYTDDDAISVASFLAERGYSVTLRTNKDASKAQFEADINMLNGEVNENDLVLFYYSGHGAQTSDVKPALKGIEPPDRDPDDEWIFLYGSIYYDTNGSLVLDSDKTYTDDSLAEELKVLNNNKKVVILDSCNSGGFIGNYLEADRVPQTITDKQLSMNEILKKAIDLYVNYDSNRSSSPDIPPDDAIVISAAGESEFSYESSSIGHGIFTYYLLQADPNADLNGDGFVTTIELYSFTKAAIELSRYPFSPHVSGGPEDFILF